MLKNPYFVFCSLPNGRPQFGSFKEASSSVKSKASPATGGNSCRQSVVSPIFRSGERYLLWRLVSENVKGTNLQPWILMILSIWRHNFHMDLGYRDVFAVPETGWNKRFNSLQPKVSVSPLKQKHVKSPSTWETYCGCASPALHTEPPYHTLPGCCMSMVFGWMLLKWFRICIGILGYMKWKGPTSLPWSKHTLCFAVLAMRNLLLSVFPQNRRVTNPKRWE